MDLNFVKAVPTSGWTQACVYCGVIIVGEQANVEEERKWENINGSPFLFRRVWHKQCQMEYLEQGEVCLGREVFLWPRG